MRAIAEQNNALPLIKLDEEYANLVREVDPSFINDRNEVRLDLSDVKNVNISVDFESTKEACQGRGLRLDLTPL